MGYGSIAKRHISNLQSVCEKRSIALEVELLRHTNAPTPEGIYASHTSTMDLMGIYDAVFITNPTSMHYETLSSLLDTTNCFFIEKPVFDRTDLDTAPFACAHKVFYVACPLRYSSVVQWMKKSIDFSTVISMRCISSSYLPDWRPGTDYRNTYSAHANMGGGVHIDLIHEWDYINYLIGMPQSVRSIIVKRSQLEIDSPDTAIYIADYGDKTVEVHLDYYGRVTIRRAELITTTDTIVCDICNGYVEYLKAGQCINLKEERNDFQTLEIEHFLDVCMGLVPSGNTIEEATSILSLTRGEMG